MFQPASLKGESPVAIDERIRNRFLLFYLFLIVFSFIPVAILEYWYVTYLWNPNAYLLFFILAPVNILITLHLLQISAILISKMCLIIVNLFHKPVQGEFTRNIKDKDYFYWNLRNIMKKWPLFITASNPFPWVKNRFVLRFFGVKIGKHSICDNCWISSEFIEIGENVIIGMNSVLISFGIEQEKFIIKKVIIGNNVVIGAKCVILPGTTIRDTAKLSAHSYTSYNSILEKDQIYLGHPAKMKSNE
ncbi:MAG: acyltransferase [Candidatus Thorarchaeota archaeon]